MNNHTFSGKNAASETVKTDKKDIKLIKALSGDSRIPLTRLTKNIKLSRDSLNYRIQRLRKAGIIQRFYPSLDFPRFNFRPYHFFLLTDERKREKHSELLKFLETHPSTRMITHYSDKWDLGWTILAKDMQDFDRIHKEFNERFSQVILDKDVLATIERYLISSSPFLTKQLYDPNENQEITLDKKDYALLAELANDARTSAIQLGRKVGLSSDAIIYRIKRMKKAGVIKYFTTLFDLSRLGYHLYTYCIDFTYIDKKHEAKIKAFIYSQPNIIRAEKVFGDYDLMLQIAAPSPGDFHALVKEIKLQFADIIQRYDTWIADDQRYYVLPPALHTGQ